MKIKLNSSSPRGPSIVVVVISKFLCEFFSLPQIPKTVQASTGENSAKCNALNSYIERGYPFAVIFADPEREGYKFHSLLGSVGTLSAETNINFQAPPLNQISGICKNLADTWPAATRVRSWGRKREDPRNEVVCFRTVYRDLTNLNDLNIVPFEGNSESS